MVGRSASVWGGAKSKIDDHMTHTTHAIATDPLDAHGHATHT